MREEAILNKEEDCKLIVIYVYENIKWCHGCSGSNSPLFEYNSGKLSEPTFWMIPSGGAKGYETNFRILKSLIYLHGEREGPTSRCEL